MTHDFSFHISSDLDYQTANIKIADDIIFQTKRVGIINFYDLIKNKYTEIVISNIYYIPKLYINLISFRELEKKSYEFCTINIILQIINQKKMILS